MLGIKLRLLYLKSINVINCLLIINIKVQDSALSKAIKNKDLNRKSFNMVTFRLNLRRLQTKWIILQVEI